MLLSMMAGTQGVKRLLIKAHNSIISFPERDSRWTDVPKAVLGSPVPVLLASREGPFWLFPEIINN